MSMDGLVDEVLGNARTGSTRIRKVFLKALGHIADTHPEAMCVLLSALQAPQEGIRGGAAEGLVRVFHLAYVREAFTKALLAQAAPLRRAVSIVLREQAGQEVVRTYLLQLARTKQAETGTYCEVLFSIGGTSSDTEIIGVLDTALCDQRVRVRKEAVSALSTSQGELAEGALIRALGDLNTDVRIAATYALVERKLNISANGQDQVNTLMVRGPSPDIRWQASTALRAFATCGIVPQEFAVVSLRSAHAIEEEQGLRTTIVAHLQHLGSQLET